jgi:hypothetical protein
MADGVEQIQKVIVTPKMTSLHAAEMASNW